MNFGYDSLIGISAAFLTTLSFFPHSQSIYFFVVRILMYKQVSFMITEAITLTALVTIGLCTGSETAVPAILAPLLAEI